MEQRRLGDSGLLVSAVGLGTNNFAGRLHDEAARMVLNEALEQGITSLASVAPAKLLKICMIRAEPTIRGLAMIIAL